MKAAFIERHGGPEVISHGEIAEPSLAAGEVMVDIHAASVNGADWKVRAGKNGEAPWFPYILGRDFSGLVAVGDGEFKAGDAVFGVCDVGREGAYAEKMAIKSSIIAAKPDSLSHVEAAALSLTGLTALVSIEDCLQLKAGEKILIQGGAGGVAGFAIQVAKHIGAQVITTASAQNHDYLWALGADQVIDYSRQDFAEQVTDCDAVFETVGGEVAERSFQVLKPGGRIAFIASGSKALKSPRPDVAALRPAVGRDRSHLLRILELVAAGAVAIPEISLYALSEAAKAHTISEARHLRGKLVLQVRQA